MKLKNFGRKMKKKNKTLEKKRLELLNLSISIVSSSGWNNLLFKKISKQKNISINKLELLYPNGYIDMIKFMFLNLNNELKFKCKEYDLINIPIHKRIRKILLTNFIIMNKNKNFYKKTFFHLLIPSNNRILFKELSKTVNIMWYIANDKSTDFNFYTKRAILLTIYFPLLIFFFNNSNLIELEKKLDEKLGKVSKIPIIKNKLRTYLNFVPSFFK